MTKLPYHHGDLANALVAAASAIVEQDGADALSLRDLAAQLGVSRAAPYRHFEDRDALLAAVAARGFEDLNAEYEAVLAAPGDGMERLRRANQAFHRLSTSKPGLHRLMFQNDLLERTPPPRALVGPANRNYELLLQAVAGAHPGADEKAVKARTIVMWSTLYGFHALDGAGRFKPFMIEPLTHDELVEAVMAAAMGR